MRMIFGVLSLLLALAVVGFLVKKQLPSVNQIKVPDATALSATSADASASEPASTALAIPSMSPFVNLQQQSQQIQQQVQQQLKAATEATLQQARQMPDEK